MLELLNPEALYNFLKNIEYIPVKYLWVKKGNYVMEIPVGWLVLATSASYAYMHLYRQ